MFEKIGRKVQPRVLQAACISHNPSLFRSLPQKIQEIWGTFVLIFTPDLSVCVCVSIYFSYFLWVMMENSCKEGALKGVPCWNSPRLKFYILRSFWRQSTNFFCKCMVQITKGGSWEGQFWRKRGFFFTSFLTSFCHRFMSASLYSVTGGLIYKPQVKFKTRWPNVACHSIFCDPKMY